MGTLCADCRELRKAGRELATKVQWGVCNGIIPWDSQEAFLLDWRSSRDTDRRPPHVQRILYSSVLCAITVRS